MVTVCRDTKTGGREEQLAGHHQGQYGQGHHQGQHGQKTMRGMDGKTKSGVTRTSKMLIIIDIICKD